MQTADDWGRLAKAAQYKQAFSEPNWAALPYASAIYAYDVADRLTSVTPYNDQQTGEANVTMGYDTAGRKVTMTDPDMGTWSYGYDKLGNLVWQTDANGKTLCNDYDMLNRLVYVREDQTPPQDCTGALTWRASHEYDSGANGIGRRNKLSDLSGNTVWDYDKRGRATKETKTISSASFVTQRTYDAMDRVKTMTYPGNEVVTYGYNPQGLLESMTTSLGANIKYVESSAYDASSRLTQRMMRNSSTIAWTTNYTYYPWTTVNGWGRLQSIFTGSLQNLSYTYDAVGNVKGIVDGANSSQKQCFNYDELDRLTQGFTGNTGCTAYAGAGYGAFEEQYSYFANGNLDHKKMVAPTYQDDACIYGASSPSGCTAGTPATKPHAVRQAGGNTYSYDCNGNMTGRTVGGTSYTLTYDAENRLTEVKQGSTVQATYTYDGDGNRVKATVGGVTTLYPGRHYEYVNSTTYTKYYYAGSDLVAFERSSGYGSTAGYGRRFVFRDHLNSTSVIVNGSNSTIAKDLYRPYGDVRYQWRSGTPVIATQTQYRYTGQRLEAGVGAPSPVGGLDRGLYFYGARWYDASLARFVQADTIVPNPGNPQALNRYSYVLNNPIKYTDPSGHANECAIQVGLGCDLGPILPTPIVHAPPETMDNIAAVGEAVAGLLFEPADWVITARDVYEGKGSPWMLLGLLPFVPSSVGKYGDETVDIVKRLDKDLFAFGNRTGPRPPRVGKDVTPGIDGVLSPQTPPFPNGASTFADPLDAPPTGHYHRLPAGTKLPAGLDVVADGLDVSPASPHPATHHTIFNTIEMTLERFGELFTNLPWQYGGKK